MTTFQSKGAINKPVSDVYLFLSDMNNHQQLMPDGVTNWQSTTNDASFTVQNMLKLSLKMGECAANREIKIIPSEKPPFDLELKWALSSNNDQTNVVFTITADLNMMMKMMASGPLQKLADHEVQTLSKILS
jgi:carbon monoxide dehydrogenase subunit G